MLLLLQGECYSHPGSFVQRPLVSRYTHPYWRTTQLHATIGYRLQRDTAFWPTVSVAPLSQHVVCLSSVVCDVLYSGETAGPICMKFSGKVWSDHGTTSLHFGSIRINRAMPNANSLSATLRETRLNRFAWMHHSFCIIVCYRAVRSAILATARLLVLLTLRSSTSRCGLRRSIDLCVDNVQYVTTQIIHIDRGYM